MISKFLSKKATIIAYTLLSAFFLLACQNLPTTLNDPQWQTFQSQDFDLSFESPATYLEIIETTETPSQLPSGFAQSFPGCDSHRAQAFFNQEEGLCTIHINPPNNASSQIVISLSSKGEKTLTTAIQEQILDSISFSGQHQLDFIDIYFDRLLESDPQLQEVEIINIQKAEEIDPQSTLYQIRAKYLSLNDQEEIEEKNYEIYLKVSYDQGFIAEEQGKNLIKQSNYLSAAGIEDFITNEEKVISNLKLHDQPDLVNNELYDDDDLIIYGLEDQKSGYLIKFNKDTNKNSILGQYQDLIRFKKLDSNYFLIESGQGTFPETCMDGLKTKEVYRFDDGSLETTIQIRFLGTKSKWGYKSIIMPLKELAVYQEDPCFTEDSPLSAELPPAEYLDQLFVKSGNNYTVVSEDVTSSALILEDADLQKNINQEEKFYFHLGGKEYILEEETE